MSNQKLMYTIKGINKTITKEEMQAVLQAHADLYYPKFPAPLNGSQKFNFQKHKEAKKC